MVSQLAITTVKKEMLEASEERLKRSNEQLQAEMIERQRAEAERREMESQLQRAQKMQTLGNLASGVAHDLNNILSGLVSYPELLMTELTEEDPLRAKLATIQRSGQKAADIVEDLLSLSRKGTTAKTPIDLNKLIRDSLQNVEFKHLRANYPELGLDVRLDSQPLGVMAAPTLLSRVLLNLVFNAAEATSVRGVVSITTSCQTIAQTQNGYEHIPPGTYAVLSISDNGVGLTEDELDNIFEPFFTKKVLGRSGTRFTLYFPKVRLIPSQSKSQASIEDYKARGESVLVVDDVEDQRLIASSIMEKLGYRVESVSSGEAAVAFLKQHPMDLIILDMVMEPGMDGLDTYQEILKIRPDQKTILASGYSDSERIHQALELGAGRLISKPYRMDSIGMAVRTELDR